MSRYGYLEVFQRVPLEFEITRVDCISEDTPEMPQSRRTAPPPTSPQSTKNRKEEDQIRTKQTSHMKLEMYKQRRTAIEEPSSNGQ